MAIVGGNLIVYLTTDTTQFERGMSKSTSMLDGFKDSAKIAAGVLMRDLARGLTQGAVEALKMGAQIQTLRTSFESLSAATGDYVPSLQDLRRATQGMVSDTDLLLRANEALALGIPTENLDDLFDSAIRLGKAMGLDAAQGIQALTIGVGRQSRLVLDNLGIIVRAEEAYEEYARRIGKTTETLTENERRLGFQTIALEKISEKADVLGDNISDTEKNMSQWTATIKNATTALGELLQPLGALAPVFQTLGPTIGVMAATILPTLSAATLGWLGLGIAFVTSITVLIGAFQKWRRETDEVIIAQDRLEAAGRRVAVVTKDMADASNALEAALASQEASHDAVNDAINKRAEASRRLVDAEDELLKAETDLAIAQQDLANYVSFLTGEAEGYVAVTHDMTFSSEAARQALADLSTSSDDARQAFMGLSTELGILQGEYSATLQVMSELNDEMGVNTDAINKSRYEIDKIKDSIQDRADEYAGEIQALEDEKEALDAVVKSGQALNWYGRKRLKDIPLEIQALREKSRATADEAQQIRDYESTIRDLRLENTKLSFSLDDVKDSADEQAKAIEEQEQTLGEQETALTNIQDTIDALIEKDDDAEKAQEAVTDKTEAVEEALDAEKDALEAVEDALGNLATAHDTVVDAQETLMESNFALESSLRAIELATNDLATAEAERERQRIEREQAQAQAQAEGDIAPDGYHPTGGYSPDEVGLYPTGGDKYSSATTQTSAINIRVDMTTPRNADEARDLAKEFADQAVKEMRRLGVKP